MEIETQIKVGISAAVLVSLVLSFFGGAMLFDGSDDTYYCEDRQLVVKCDRLSSTNKTCYYVDDEGDKRSKRCLTSPYWIPVINDLEVEKEVIVEVINEVEVVKVVEVIKEVIVYEESPRSTGRKEICIPEGCVEVG